MTDGGRVVVTGAGGFIGRHLVNSLARDGVQVRGITRAETSLGDGVEVAVVRDLNDRDAIRAGLTGADAVVHLAGRVHAKPEGKNDPASECRRVNVEGTSLLLEEAVAAGVKKFVFMSSVKAVRNESSIALTPDTPPQPTDAYGESKLEAERLVRFASVRAGMSAPVLRLPVVYGPGMKANMATLFRAVDRGVPLPLASVRNRRSFAYVGNVVAAIRAVLDADIPGTETFYVSDGEDLSTPDLIRRVAASLGRPARLVPMPTSILRAAGRTGGLLSRIRGVHFSTESVTALLGSLFVDDSSLREMTSYVPPCSVDKGMFATAEWFRASRSGTGK